MGRGAKKKSAGGGARMSNFKVPMDAAHAASLKCRIALEALTRSLERGEVTSSAQIAEAKAALAATAIHERQENVDLMKSAAFKRLKALVEAFDGRAAAAATAKASEAAIFAKLSARRKKAAAALFSEAEKKQFTTLTAGAWETSKTAAAGWRALASGEQIRPAGCVEALYVEVGDKVSLAWTPRLLGRGNPPLEIASCDSDHKGPLSEDVFFEPCWLKQRGGDVEEVCNWIDSGVAFASKEVSVVIQDPQTLKRLTFSKIPLRFLRRCSEPTSIWSAIVTRVRSFAGRARTVEIRYTGSGLHGEVPIERIQELKREGGFTMPQPTTTRGKFVSPVKAPRSRSTLNGPLPLPYAPPPRASPRASSTRGKEKTKKKKPAKAATSAEEVEAIWKQRMRKLHTSTPTVTWLRRKSKKKRGMSVPNGKRVPTQEFRYKVALMCWKGRFQARPKRVHAGKFFMYNAEADLVDFLRKQGWKVGLSTMREWATKLKNKLQDPRCEWMSIKHLGCVVGRKLEISDEEMVSIVEEFKASRLTQSRGPINEAAILEKIRLVHKQKYTATYSLITYSAMDAATERRTVKKILAFFRPGEKARERSVGRQAEMTSMVNAISEFITASAIQRIPGKPGHYILKENLTNYDPVTFIYNLTVRGSGFGITLVPAAAGPSETASVAAKGGRKALSHSMKWCMATDATGGHSDGHMLVKVPPKARKGLTGDNAAPIVREMKKFGGLSEPQSMFLVAIIGATVEDLSQSESDSGSERLFRDTIWPRILVWMKWKASKATMDRGPDEDDDDLIFKRMGFTLDSSLPEIKALLKFATTEECKALDLALRKIGAKYTGNGQAADAGDAHPNTKCVVATFECFIIEFTPTRSLSLSLTHTHTLPSFTHTHTPRPSGVLSEKWRKK